MGLVGLGTSYIPPVKLFFVANEFNQLGPVSDSGVEISLGFPWEA